MITSSQFNVVAILNAFTFLSGRCNGATSHDNVGFRKGHTVYDNSFVATMVRLADRPNASLSFKQIMCALRILGTYKNTQLVENWGEINKLDVGVVEFTSGQNGNLWEGEIFLPQEIIEFRKINCSMKFAAPSEETLVSTIVDTLRKLNLSGKLHRIQK